MRRGPKDNVRICFLQLCCPELLILASSKLQLQANICEVSPRMLYFHERSFESFREQHSRGKSNGKSSCKGYLFRLIFRKIGVKRKVQETTGTERRKASKKETYWRASPSTWSISCYFLDQNKCRRRSQRVPGDLPVITRPICRRNGGLNGSEVSCNCRGPTLW